MSGKGGLVCLLWVVLVLGAACLPAAISAAGAELRACNASIAECRSSEEFLMDSETHRRFLQQGQHIGYRALQPDRAVCNPGRNNPYYCVPARSGNPPSRGCNPIYGCRIG